MNGHHPANLARSAQILRFLLKYRGAGVFTGIDLDTAALGTEALVDPQAGQPEEFVEDLEALGPTFVKIGQALSTRPDMKWKRRQASAASMSLARDSGVSVGA